MDEVPVTPDHATPVNGQLHEDAPGGAPQAIPDDASPTLAPTDSVTATTADTPAPPIEPTTPTEAPRSPKLGEVVRYTLTGGNAVEVNRRRHPGAIEGWIAGSQRHVGNPAAEGDVLAAIVVRVWPGEFPPADGANLQVLLDGNDVLWVTSTREGDTPGTFQFAV